MDFEEYDDSGVLKIAVNNPENMHELPFIITGPVSFGFSMVGGGDWIEVLDIIVIDEEESESEINFEDMSFPSFDDEDDDDY